MSVAGGPLPLASGRSGARPRNRFAGLAAILLAAVTACLLPAAALGGTPELATLDEGGRQEMPNRFAVSRDPTRHLTLSQVRALPERSWQVIRGAQIAFGFSTDVFWIRMAIQNLGGTAAERVLELPATLDSVDLFELGKEGQVRHEHAGKKTPYSERDLRTGEVAFRLTFLPGERKELWVRTEGHDSMAIRPLLWTPSAFLAAAARRNLVAAAYFGALGTMVLFNLFIWFSIRDRAYLRYCLFQGAVILMFAALDGKSFHYLWPESPEWASRSEVVFTCLAFVAGARFARAFLGRDFVTRLGDHLVQLLIGMASLVGVLGLFTDHSILQMILQVVVVCACAGVLAVGLAAALRGSANGTIFVVAWLILLVSGILSAITYGGLATEYVFQIEIPRMGSVAEAILLSFGLARRIKLAQRESELAQQKLVMHERAQAQTLERRVADRTQELRNALERLRATQDLMVKQARLAALGHLMAGVAHEVGNPLNFVIGGTSEVIRRLESLRLALPPACRQEPVVEKLLAEAQQAADLVRNGSERIQHLIENLRAYFRVRTQETRPVQLVEVLEATLALVRSLMRTQNITAHRDFQPVPPVMSRTGELSQVFLNLILNSCHAMPGGGTITIQTRLVDGQRVEVVIADTGPGIPPEHRDSIFDPFFTTRQGEGTGLGLSVSLRIVEAHDGELRLVDGDGGAVFVVSFPVATAAPPADP